jgi:nicotinamide mononucleotide (NMN) deamidase PncC
MTFYVEKQLPVGPIRFGVSTRARLEAIAGDTALSTGPKGEFVRRGTEGSYFGDSAIVVEPSLPVKPGINQTPFWWSLKPDGTQRGYVFLGLIGFGILLIILGFSVLATKGPQGWVEVILGVICIAIPIVMTAQQRRQIHAEEERQRIEREAATKRDQELLTWYTNALNHLHTDRGDAALTALRGERESLAISYEIYAPAARRVILDIGFEELARNGVAESAAIATLLRNAGDAAGLTPEDITGAARDLYATVVWHLLADDRLGNTQEAELLTLRKGLGIADDDVPIESNAIEQFRSLRAVASGLPRAQCPVPLAIHEYCIQQAPLHDRMLFITNRRLIIEGKKHTEVMLPKVFEVVVEVDADSIAIKTDQKKPLRLRLGNPIFTAGLIDFAAELDERPKGFA